MVKLFAWFRRRGFRADARVLRNRMATPEDRVHVLQHLTEHLKRCTYSGRPEVNVDISHIHSTPLITYAGNCDLLLLSLKDAAAIVESDSGYGALTYVRQEKTLIMPVDYMVDNNLGYRITPATLVPKLVLFSSMLTSALQEQISEERSTVAHHLRRTSNLVEEAIRVAYYLLAISDQRLIPPSA